MRLRIAASSSIWLNAGTASRAPDPGGCPGGAPGLHAESETHQGAASGASGSAGLTRRIRRTRSAGVEAMNSSTSQASVSHRVAATGKLARPTVAPPSQGDHAPAENTDISKRKPATPSPSTLSAGTRR
jgi:hypothetical protein